MGIRLLPRKRSCPNPPLFEAGEWFLKQQGNLLSSRRQDKTLVLFSELDYVDRILNFLYLPCLVEKVCAKLYIDLSVFINSHLYQNSINNPLLQQKYLMSLLRSLRIGVDQFSHL